MYPERLPVYHKISIQTKMGKRKHNKTQTNKTKQNKKTETTFIPEVVFNFTEMKFKLQQ